MNYSISPDQRTLIEEQLDRGGASKRARALAKVLMEHGSCSTTELKEMGQEHPPSAARDLKNAGVGLDMKQESYVNEEGKKKRRGRYSLSGVIAEGRHLRHGLSKKFEAKVKAPGQCAGCGASPPLQSDHKIPFEIGGETYPHVLAEFQPLCRSCNRAKSWTCEKYCENWTIRDKEICRDCMWASPGEYRHVAMKQVRQVRISLEDPEDIRLFDEAHPDTKQVLQDWLRDGPDD